MMKEVNLLFIDVSLMMSHLRILSIALAISVVWKFSRKKGKCFQLYKVRLHNGVVLTNTVKLTAKYL